MFNIGNILRYLKDKLKIFFVNTKKHFIEKKNVVYDQIYSFIKFAFDLRNYKSIFITNIKLHFESIRFFKPQGMLLVFYPCLFQLCRMYYDTEYFISWCIFFLIGSFLARSAGCIINDIIDKDIDYKVCRTHSRIITNEKVSVEESLLLMFLLSIIGLGMLSYIGIQAFLLGFIIGIGIIVYPLCKRFFDYPQVILGIVFNSGSLFVSLALKSQIDTQSLFLYSGCILWTVFYDTIYAHQDKEFDRNINLHSMALTKIGSNLTVLCKFFSLGTFFWALSFLKFSDNSVIILVVLFSLVFIHNKYITSHINLDNPSDCNKYFSTNAYIIGPVIALIFLFSSI